MPTPDRLRRCGQGRALPLQFAGALLVVVLFLPPQVALADQVRLHDGTAIEAEEVWEDAGGVWYRQGGVTHWVERGRVRSIERAGRAKKDAGPKETSVGVKADDARPSEGVRAKALVKVVAGERASDAATLPTVFIHLVGGARMEVDEATGSAEGVWYRRGNLSIFVERARIERIERERAVEESAAEGEGGTGPRRARRARFWTTGSVRLDALIRQSGAAHGVDPYLIFCVMEQESQFNARAVSPKGARGLMQLMPGTAARFGVRNPHDPAQNVRGGTIYLRQLLSRFGGRVDLALASYNAGEGAVLKYGQRVPPYRETREYVRRISARYRQDL